MIQIKSVNEQNIKAENRPLMKVICSLLLLAPCLSALMISCCKYFLITVKLRLPALFLRLFELSTIVNYHKILYLNGKVVHKTVHKLYMKSYV